MTPDDLAIRTYERERDNHRKDARRLVELAKQRIDGLLEMWDLGPSSMLAANARHATELTGEAWAHIQAYLALHDVRFLIERPAAQSGQEG